MLAVDISVLGVPELERKLKRMSRQVQRKIVAQALRKSAVRTKKRVIENLSGLKVEVQTGELLAAFKSAKIRGSTRAGFIRRGITFPERDAIGIDADDKDYWPSAVEYGHKRAPAHPYLRPAIDENEAQEKAIIARDIGAGIDREAAKT